MMEQILWDGKNKILDLLFRKKLKIAFIKSLRLKVQFMVLEELTQAFIQKVKWRMWTDVKPTISEAHARCSAISREYEYVILNRSAPPALDDGRVWHQRIDLDIKNMKKAANHLVGTHDFTSYRATQCQSNSPIKTLDELSINKVFDKVFVRAKARSFLHHQVRNIVGTLKLVGSGKWDPEDVLSALEKKDRAAAGPTAPACGLTLINIDYPKDIYL